MTRRVGETEGHERETGGEIVSAGVYLKTISERPQSGTSDHVTIIMRGSLVETRLQTGWNRDEYSSLVPDEIWC
jgi:hypothetical protein